MVAIITSSCSSNYVFCQILYRTQWTAKFLLLQEGKRKKENRGLWCWCQKGWISLLLSASHPLASPYRVAVGREAQVAWPWTMPGNSIYIYRISKTTIISSFLVFGLLKNSSLVGNRWVNKQRVSNWFFQDNVNPEWKSGRRKAKNCFSY